MSDEDDDRELTAEELGWEIPVARILVPLAGLEDADWVLEEDERQP